MLDQFLECFLKVLRVSLVVTAATQNPSRPEMVTKFSEVNSECFGQDNLFKNEQRLIHVKLANGEIQIRYECIMKGRIKWLPKT